MTGLEVRVFADATALGEALAAQVADGIAEAATAGRRYVLGCPGGRSPRTTYRALAVQVARRGLDLSGLVVAMMDDYVLPGPDGYHVVPAGEHYSVRRFAAEEVLGPLNAAAGAGRGVTEDRLWFPDPADPAAYDERLVEAGVDLFLLASGDSDGHVAFNPPGTPLAERTRVAALADTTRRDNLGTFPGFGSVDEVPRHGLGVGPATIRDCARRAVLVATGAAKRTAVARLRAARGYEPDWPATVLLECRSPALWTDVAADATPGPSTPSHLSDPIEESRARRPAPTPRTPQQRGPSHA